MSDQQPEKTCFPKWMIRLNPYLRRADRNVLLLYMKERSNRRWGSARIVQQLFNLRLLVVYIVTLLVMYFTTGSLGFGAFFSLFILALIVNGLIHIVRNLMNRSGIDKPFRIPGSVDAMVSIERGDFAMMEEFWKGGTDGDDIQEALYFQSVWTIYFGYLMTMVLGFVLPWLVLLAEPSLVTTAFFLISAYYFLYGVFKVLLSVGGIRERQRFFRIRQLEYGIVSLLAFDWKKGLKEFLTVLLVVLGVILAMIILISIVTFLGSMLSFLLQKEVILWAMILCFLFFGYQICRRRRRVWIKSVRAFERSKKQMSFAVDTYIRAVLLKDPDWKVGIELELEEMQERRRKRK